MTSDDIIRMAREAGCSVYVGDGYMIFAFNDRDETDTCASLERFTALVAAAEREACAKTAADFLTSGRSPLGRSVAAAIRARGNP